MADKPTLCSMVDTGVSVRRITEFIRHMISDPEANITIQYNTILGWTASVETTRGTVIRSSYGDEEIATLACLFEQLVAAAGESERSNGREPQED